MAWRVGPYRAARVGPSADGGAHQTLANMRTRMLAAQRHAATQWMCTVLGLAASLSARWPVRDRDLSVREGLGLRLAASPGESITSPMGGTVGYTGRDGNRGECVEVLHACQLRTEVCHVNKPLVSKGQRVEAGTPVALAGKTRPRFNMWLGAQALDVAQQMPPEQAFPGTVPQPEQEADKLETIQMGADDLPAQEQP